MNNNTQVAFFCTSLKTGQYEHETNVHFKAFENICNQKII